MDNPVESETNANKSVCMRVLTNALRMPLNHCSHKESKEQCCKPHSLETAKRSSLEVGLEQYSSKSTKKKEGMIGVKEQRTFSKKRRIESE